MNKTFFVFVMMCLMTGLVLGNQESKENPNQPGSKVETLKYHIVVTASRTEQPVIEIGSSTTLITFEELKKTGKTTVADVLAEVPGLDVVQHGGAGKEADVFMRGANSEHTLVLVDGIEVNDPISPGRTFDFAHLSLDNIERIEVVRGPQSTLYGSDAMGGVIHIITKKGEGKPKVFISAETGSYNSFRESAGVNGGSNTVNYSLGISRFDTKGFSASSEKYGNTERDSYRNTSCSGRLGFNPFKNLELQLVGRFTDAKNDLDNSSGAGGDDPNYTDISQQLLLAANAKLRLGKGKWEQRLGISYSSTRHDYDNPTDNLHSFDSSEGMFKGDILKIDWQHNLYVHSSHTITAGLEYEQETGESEYYWDSAWGPGQSLFPGKSTHTTALFLQDNIKIRDRFFMIMGVRFDHHNQFGTEITYRLAPAVVLESGTRIKATYGTGFKAPSLYQLFAPAAEWGPVGNEYLLPEKSRGWDVGIEQFLWEDHLVVSFTYFHNDFNALILYDWMLGYINIKKADTRGFEILLSAHPFKSFTLQGSYTYTDAFDKDTDEQLLRRPKHKANLNVHLRLSKNSDVDLNILYVGKRIDLFPYPTRTEAPAYTLLNLAASYRLSKNIEIFGRVVNLLDKEYETVLGYGSPRRSAYIGIKANY